MAGPDGPRYLLDSTSDSFTVPPGFLGAYPEGLLALEGNDTVTGSGDNELIFGNQGEDWLFGGVGNDSLWGGKQNDFLYGQAGNDLLNGNFGNDFVNGGDGDDLIRGGKDNDFLVGGNGNDILIGDFGQDVLKGGGGSDFFVVRTDTAVTEQLSVDVIIDYDKSGDRIGLTGGITEANLTFESFNLSLAGLSDLVDISTIPPAAFAEFDLQQLDPNGDGVITGTFIGIGTNNQFLGAVLNATAADLSGRFINADALIG